MNIVLGAVSILVTFSLLVLFEKLFKKEGLYVWMGISTIIANIIVCKNIEIFGITATLGNVLFASTFLATDMMTEKYDVKDSKKAVLLGLASQVMFIVITQMALLFIPAEEDIAHGAMKELFSINIRVSISSMTMFFIANMADIYLFQKIKERIPNKLWLRNNIATIVSNCIENYFFVTLAFIGIYDIQTIIAIATSTTILEMIIAICDTPFLYLSKKI